MKKTNVSFAELRTFLSDVGLMETPEKTRFRFVHPKQGTILLFRRYRPKDLVTQADMFVVRRELVDDGLIDDEALDRFMQTASA